MPDKFRNQQISSVTDMLGQFFDAALKRQEQFKDTRPLVDVIDPETGETVLRRAEAGLVRKPGIAEVNWSKIVQGELNIASGMNPNQAEKEFLDLQAKVLEGQPNITKDVAENMIKEIRRTSVFEKPVVKKPVVEPFVEKLQNLNFKDQAKITKLEEEIIPEVSIEPAVKAQKKKGLFGIDRFAKDIEAQPQRYFEIIIDTDTGVEEKVFIDKPVYDKRLRNKAKKEKDIKLLNRRIKARNIRIEKAGVKTLKELPETLTPAKDEKSRFDKFKVK